jgi:four helix bundle protein
MVFAPAAQQRGRIRFSARFCSIAIGSASELEYHLLVAKDLKLIKPRTTGSWASAP